MIGLTKWHNMAFYADCHAAPWSASPLELQETRAFLGETWMEANWGDALPPYSPPHADGMVASLPSSRSEDCFDRTAQR